MSNQHRKPVLAFILLVVVAAAVISLQLRASAAGSVSDGAGSDGHSSAGNASQPAPAASLD